MLLVEMSVVTTISFLAHLVPALRIYIYIYICADGARGRTLAHVQATWARPTMRARTELFIPAGDSVSLVSFSFSATLWTSENSPHPRPIPPPSSPSPTTRFLSFLFFLLFSLLLPIFSSRLQSSQEEIRPLGSRNILENIFDFSREPLSRDFSAKKFLFVVESFLFSLSFFLSKKFSSKGEKRFPCTLSRENNRFREAAYLEFLPRI